MTFSSAESEGFWIFISLPHAATRRVTSLAAGAVGDEEDDDSGAVVVEELSVWFMFLDGIDVSEASTVRDFFQGMGTTYLEFANAETLGEHSYTYEMDSFLQTMIQKCPTVPSSSENLTVASHGFVF